MWREVEISPERVHSCSSIAQIVGHGGIKTTRSALDYLDDLDTLDYLEAMKTGHQLIDEAKTRIRQISPREVIQMRERGEDFAIIDVREDREWNLGHLPGAVHVARGTLEGKIEGAVPRERKVVLYCARGNRSALAADTMREMGYRDVASMTGGIQSWVDAGGEIEG
ncbi:MAG TPA: rhodanese-like domain-containing protein [Gemmatimonadaceae bacterium]|nr:rhodanese-like domain-containing protein [Gemmatimonadaceae bacterium]